MKNETTQTDFELFTQTVKKYAEKFGLHDWQIEITHGWKDEQSRAQAMYHVQGHLAVISLAKDWGEDCEEPTAYKIRRSAFHEVCELLLSEYYAAATDDDLRGEALRLRLEREGHRIIRRLENVVFPLMDEPGRNQVCS